MSRPLSPEVKCDIDELFGSDASSTADATANGTPHQAQDSAPEAELEAASSQAGRRSQADMLVAIARQSELFHDANGEAYATIKVSGHYETHPVRSRGYRDWLARQLHEAEGKTPGAQAVQDALSVITGQAKFDGPCETVHVRLAGTEDNDIIYIDLGDYEWRVVEVDRDGWRVVVDRPPVRFRRPRGMRALPEPEPCDSLDLLWEYINLDKDDRPLLAAWLVQALNPRGPYPVAGIAGEQGAAKTTTALVMRALIDPNAAPTRADPREGRDLMVSAVNGWALVYDNLSRLPDWLSDAFCRLSTGGGFSTRQLYSDNEEMLFEATRPLILTGIEEVVTRGDLLDRSIRFTLPAIPGNQRKPEREYWEGFERDRPRILGALLDRVSRALREVGDVRLESLPRMADFAIWAYAAVDKKEGQAFLAAYSANRESAHRLALDDTPLAQPLLTLIENGSAWEGTAAELLDRLNEGAGEAATKRRSWPKSGAALSGQLRRLAPHLRAIGISLTFERTKEERRIVLERVREKSVTGVIASSDAENPDSDGPNSMTLLDAKSVTPRHPASPERHQDKRTDQPSDIQKTAPESGNLLRGGAGDDGDGKLHSHSGGIEFQRNAIRGCLACAGHDWWRYSGDGWHMAKCVICDPPPKSPLQMNGAAA